MTKWISMVVLSALVATGCSFSDSAMSIAESISSPATLASRSSDGDDSGEEFETDVREFTAAHIRSGGEATDLGIAVSELAAERGVSDWERNRSAAMAVGAGLAEAGCNESEFQEFAANFVSGDEQDQWLREGYASFKTD